MKAKDDLNYIQPFRYVSGSWKDPHNQGAFYLRRNYPTPISDNSLRGRSVITRIHRQKDRVIVTLANGTAQTQTFRAVNSNLKGRMEALLHGRWQPIEYGFSGGCGNVNHNVFLPAGKQWSYERQIPENSDFRTSLRFSYWLNGRRHFSNVLKTTIPKTRFHLHPELQKTSTLVQMAPGSIVLLEVPLDQAQRRRVREMGYRVLK